MPPRTLHAVGGCLCGTVRYRVSGEFVDAGYCHCRLCQRANGAPVVAWFTVRAAAFDWTAGRASSYASSTRYRRDFCAQCGTPLAFRRETAPEFIDVTIASLDDPALVEPDYHIWRMSRLPWFDTVDRLPRHDDGGPDQA